MTTETRPIRVPSDASFIHKDAFCAAGGKWDRLRAVWRVPAEEFDRLSALVADTKKLTGDTYPHREAIRAAGGQWDTVRKVWHVPGVAFDRLSDLVRGPELTDEQKAANAEADRLAAERRVLEAELQRAEEERTKIADLARRTAISNALAACTKFVGLKSKTVGSSIGHRARVFLSGPGLSGAEITGFLDTESERISGRVTIHTTQVPRLPEPWSVRVEYWDNKTRNETLDPVPAA